MENSGAKIKELISHGLLVLFTLLGYKLVTVFDLKILRYNFEVFCVESISDGFAHAKHHVEHQVPIVVAKSYGVFNIPFILFFTFDLL